MPPALTPLAEAAVAACWLALGTRLLGVYVRGSLVQPGCFVPGVSDADFVAVYLGEQPVLESSAEAQPQAAGGLDDAASLQQQLRTAADQLQRRFPAVTKVELKAVTLQPGSALHALALQRRGREGAGEQAIPAAALVQEPGDADLAFVLKTQAVCLDGWDLPRLLPDVAALPRLQLLPSLAEDVTAALERARQQLGASAGDGSSSSSDSGAAGALRWALKRCIRAAFELYLWSSSWEGSGSSSNSSSGSCDGSSSSSSRGESSGGGPKVFSRDLYWCQQHASWEHPELAPALAAALALYVELSTEAEGAAAGAPLQPPQREQLEGGLALAERLAADIDSAFLQRMLAEEPGWLTRHHDPAAVTRSSINAGGGAPWWQALRVRLWAATAGGDLESSMVGQPPPPVTAPVAGPVLTLDWRLEEDRQRAAAIIAATAVGATGLASLPSASSHGVAEAQPPLPQPVLLKGAAAHWPAVQRWSLAHLAAAGLEGQARLAPSLQFPFTELRLAALLAVQQGTFALPSCLARMSAAEYAARMQRGDPCGLPPLVYGGSGSGRGSGAASTEYGYFQAELPPDLLQDIDLSLPPFVAPPHGDMQPRRGAAAAGSGMRQSQAARVWVGPQGAVSPTHYDLSHSFLTQIRGRKRMLFWGPDQLPLLYFYPNTHLLRRRSRVNMHAPPEQQRAAFPLFARAAAAEAVLAPGDVIFFPSRWAHYTESLDPSMSVTCRFAA